MRCVCVYVFHVLYAFHMFYVYYMFDVVYEFYACDAFDMFHASICVCVSCILFVYVFYVCDMLMCLCVLCV